MNDFEGIFVDVPSCFLEPLSPSSVTLLSMLNHTENSPNPVTEIFSQSVTPRYQSEQIFGAAKLEFQLPSLDVENISPFAVSFGADPSVLPPTIPISSGFSPSTLLHSPSMMYDSSHIPPFLVEGSDNDVPHHQQTIFIDKSPQEGYNDTVPEDFVNVLSHESPVEPIVAPLTGSFEYEANVNFMDMLEESKNDDKNDDKDIVDLIENKNKDREIIDVDTYEEKYGDQYTTDVDKLDAGETSAPKRRICNKGSNNGAMRLENQKRVIIKMECEEENPDDGYHWRKYGRKFVKGNLNPRNYYKCTYDGCEVKKHVAREAGNEKILVITYDGMHKHNVPPPRVYGKRNQDDLAQDYTTQTCRRLDRRPFTASPHMVDTRHHLTLLDPQIGMTQCFMTGLPKLPNLPVNQNTGSINQNDRLIIHNPDFMNHQRDQSGNHNLDFVHYWDDQMVNQNSISINQNSRPVDQNSSFMSSNDQLVNQSSSSMYQNEQPIYHDPDFMFWSDIQ